MLQRISIKSTPLHGVSGVYRMLSEVQHFHTKESFPYPLKFKFLPKIGAFSFLPSYPTFCPPQKMKIWSTFYNECPNCTLSHCKRGIKISQVWRHAPWLPLSTLKLYPLYCTFTSPLTTKLISLMVLLHHAPILVPQFFRNSYKNSPQLSCGVKWCSPGKHNPGVHCDGCEIVWHKDVDLRCFDLTEILSVSIVWCRRKARGRPRIQTERMLVNAWINVDYFGYKTVYRTVDLAKRDWGGVGFLFWDYYCNILSLL